MIIVVTSLVVGLFKRGRQIAELSQNPKA